MVPYDFRPPTVQRLREAYWNPDSDRLFTDRVLGVGWAINFYKLRELARDALASLREGEAAPPRRTRRRAGNGSAAAERSAAKVSTPTTG